jgi:hypothetical protein
MPRRPAVPVIAATAALLLQSCGCGGGPPPCDVVTGHEIVSQHASDRIVLPQGSGDFAYDLNGDGLAENAVGGILGTLSSLGISSQATVDQAIAGGNGIFLLRLTSGDPSLSSTPCAEAVLRNAAAQPSPDFSGNGDFRLDTALSGLTFSGTLETAISTFTSPDPATATTPVAGPLLLPLAAGPVAVRVTGARLRTVASGANLSGQLNAAIPRSEVDGVLVPAIAASCQAIVDADPTSSDARQLLQLFDNGGGGASGCGSTCRNPDGSCAASRDGRIDPCEVGTNGLVSGQLAPDVQMFDGTGAYGPNPANAVKDCLSIGLSFTAVPARF